MSQNDSPTRPRSDAPPSSSGGPYSGPYGGPYGGPRTGFAGRGTRFFDWMRGLGIVRADGWLGGVCAGIAYRIGIDPLIVRGIVVVAAILGAPLLLLYSAAWALLPDRDGRIHLQRLFDGEFDPAMVGIGIFALLALLPWSAAPWWTGASFWDVPTWGAGIGRALWTLAVLAAIAGLVVAVVYSTRPRGDAGGWAKPAPTPVSNGERDGEDFIAGGGAGAHANANASAGAAPGAGADAGATAPVLPAGAPLGAAPTVTSRMFAGPGNVAPAALDVSAEPTEPPAPAPGASSEDLAEWQARHAAWAAEHALWKQRLKDDMRTVKAQRTTELHDRSAAAAAESAARRRAYLAANPRIGAAFGWATVGLSLVAAAITSAFWSSVTGTTGYGLTAALAAATLVLSVAILIAGLLRRRSGFLIFLALLLAALTFGSAFVPRDREFVLAADSSSSNASAPLDPAGAVTR